MAPWREIVSPRCSILSSGPEGDRGASSVRLGRSVMGKRLILALVAFLTLLTLATPSRAQVPAPKVTITGLFDQVTSMGRNFYDGNYARDGDHEWYARTRFRPDFEFAV